MKLEIDKWMEAIDSASSDFLSLDNIEKRHRDGEMDRLRICIYS